MIRKSKKLLMVALTGLLVAVLVGSAAYSIPPSDNNIYNGVWRSGSDAYVLWSVPSWSDFIKKWEDPGKENLRLIDFETFVEGGQRFYAGVWRSGSDAYALWSVPSWSDFIKKWNDPGKENLRLIDFETFVEGGQRMYAGVWRSGSDARVLSWRKGWNRFTNKWNELGKDNMRLVDLEINADFLAVPEDAMSCNKPPQMSQWQLVGETEYANQDWTEECEGVTTDGEYWYFSSNRDNDQAIYKFTLNMNFVAKADVDKYGCAHVGGLDFFNGQLYVAMEGPNKLLVLPTDFKTGKLYDLDNSPVGKDPLKGTFPWCAVSPANGMVYSSSFDNATHVHYYKKANNQSYLHAGSVKLGKTIDRAQGGDISPHCKLVMSSDASFDIKCYNVNTGQYYGRESILVSSGFPEYEEIEGLTISPPGNVKMNGKSVNVHLVLLDNDAPSGDDIFFKHFKVPFPNGEGF